MRARNMIERKLHRRVFIQHQKIMESFPRQTYQGLMYHFWVEEPDMIFVKTFTLADFAKFKNLPKESA